MSVQPTMRDTLAADLRDAHTRFFSDRTGDFYTFSAADHLLARGWRKVPDRDETIRRIADAIVRNSSSIGSRDSAQRHAETAYDALFGELAAGEAAP